MVVRDWLKCMVAKFIIFLSLYFKGNLCFIYSFVLFKCMYNKANIFQTSFETFSTINKIRIKFRIA